MQTDLPAAEFPFALRQTASGPHRLEFAYAPWRAAAPWLLLGTIWFGILLLADRNTGNLLPQILAALGATEQTLHRCSFWLLRHQHWVQAGYLTGVFFWAVAGNCWLYRCRLRMGLQTGRIVCIRGRGRTAKRERAKLRAVEEVVLVEEDGMYLWCGEDFPCLKLQMPVGDSAERRRQSQELSRRLGCAWSHSDRLGHVLGYLACP